MSAVTKQEIVDVLSDAWECPEACKALLDRIKAHGIAPPDIDANGCSTHPKARHGFARQASHSEDEYVCECTGFDPYDAGYQDGLRAAWDADGGLLPDGWVLVPEVATEQIINAIIERGAVDGDDISYDTAVLIWNDAIYAAAQEVSNEPQA